MTDPNSKFILIGLKGTGKTHYLVALDYLLDNQMDDDGLVHSDFADDRSYIQPLRERWLRGEEFERTSRQSPPPPHPLVVKHRKSGTTTGFHLPDLAGETFAGHFETRSIPSESCDRLSEATGILLFVHSKPNADHELLENPYFKNEAEALLASVQGTEIDVNGITEGDNTKGAISEAESEKKEIPEKPKEWVMKDASPQSKIVDLLQFISHLRVDRPRLKVAVIVSAWDIVKRAPAALRNELPLEPRKFLKKRWALLDQYLHTNSNVFEFRVYGVSARGGGISQQEIDRLTAMDLPSERLLVVDDEHESCDISRPVRWLLGFLA